MRSYSCQSENAMNRRPYDSPTADPVLPTGDARCDLFEDARRAAPSDEASASPWLHMIGTLRATSDSDGSVESPVRRGESSSARRALDGGHVFNATIQILDRPSPLSVVLSWSDPTRCHYGYQSWLKSVAKRAGVCAWSGGPIRCGDAIFRPAIRGNKPSNVSAMILAVYIECPEEAANSDTAANAGHRPG